jgi:rubredoxin
MCTAEGISVSGTARTGGAEVLDQGVDTDAADRDFVEFVAAGDEASGEYQCASCGYGVSVQSRLPSCPMCAGELWEPNPSTPLTRASAWRV